MCGAVTLLPHTPSCSGQKWLIFPASKEVAGLQNVKQAVTVRTWTGWQTCVCSKLHVVTDCQGRIVGTPAPCSGCLRFETWLGACLLSHPFHFTNHILTLQDMSCWKRRSTNTCTALFITRPSWNELFKLQPYWLFIVTSFRNLLSSLSLIFFPRKNVSIYISDLATFNKIFNS
jgi:hypothetical protein